MAFEVSELSEQQQLALQQYASVTDQGDEAAIPLLQRSQWNVQIAIAKFFDGEGPDPVAEAIAAQNTLPDDVPAPRRSGHQETLAHSLLQATSPANRPDPAPRVVPQSEETAPHHAPTLLVLLLTPLRYAFRLVSFFISLLPFSPVLFSLFTRPHTYRKQLKPRDCAVRLKRDLEEEFATTPFPVQLSESSYAAALDSAKRDFKYLFVILMSTEHDGHSSFIRHTLLSPQVASFFNSKQLDIITWAGDIRDTEAYSISAALRCTSFPFTAIVAYTAGRGSTPGGMSVIARMTGDIPPETWVEKACTVMLRQDPQLVEQRNESRARNLERRMREEQDSAYERSLAADRERALKKKEEQERLRNEEKQRLRMEAERIEHEVRRQQWRRWRASKFTNEPDEKDPDVVRVRITIPEHGRVLRKYRAALPVEELYAYVECYDQIENKPAEEKAAIEPQGYEHEYRFRLVSTMPRVVYDCDDSITIGQSLGKNGNLIVEPLAEDD